MCPGEAHCRPEAAARINECNESWTLCFYARLWVGVARRVADVASPQQAQSVGQSPQMQASQAQPSRSQPTRCCVVCLEEMEITMAAVPCGHCLCERCSLHVCSIMYLCMYVFKYARRLANIGRQPQGAALQYQKELASGNEIADEWSRGVILKRHEVKGFLKSGMAGLYEVKREPCHIVEHMSTAKTAQRHICSAAQRTNKLVLFS